MIHVEDLAIEPAPMSQDDTSCALCYRGLKKVSTEIHLCLCCNVILGPDEHCPNGNDEDGHGGSGWFPVGSHCKKKIPKEYR